MGRASKLKAGRRMAERVALDFKPPKAGRYAGAKWWQVLVSIFWPSVLNAPRTKVQAELEELHAAAVKNAIKKTAHAVAAGRS